MQRTGFRHTIATTLLVVAVLTVFAGFATAGLGATQATGHAPVAQQETPSPTNNTTVQHERPDNVSQPGDSQQVSQWLERRLAGQLEGSTTEISQGQYERAKERLGDDYDDRLAQYVDVAGETDSEADDQTADTLQETQQNQQELANATQEYQDTYEEYQAARERGNETAARQAARELEALSQRISATNQSLGTNYEQLENQTGTETAGAQNAISNTTQTTLARQETVRTETLVETRLRVSTNGSAVSFTDPMRITGQVTTANGTAVANEAARVTVGNRIYRTQTNETGRFTVAYRPVSLPVNATTVTVRYRPQTASPYLGATSTVPVTVTQVSPSLSATVTPTTGGYNDVLETQVVATVAGRPVPSLPVEATLGESSVSALTTGQGETVLTPRVPAVISPRQRSLRIEHTREDVAISPASTTATVSVTATATNLSVAATPRGDRIQVRGRLITADGQGVAGQRVIVSVGDTTQSLGTNRTGWYQVTMTDVSNPQTSNTSAVPVTARFDGSRTNLDSSQAMTTVNVAGVAGRGVDSSDSFLSAGQLLIGSLLGGLMMVGGAVWARRRGSASDSAPPDTEAPTPSTAPEASNISQQWLERARSTLADENARGATVAAYSAVRSRLAQQGGLSDVLTHREFHTASEAQVEDADSGMLAAVSTAYEQAIFTASIDVETATEAVEAATNLLSDSDES